VSVVARLEAANEDVPAEFVAAQAATEEAAAQRPPPSRSPRKRNRVNYSDFDDVEESPASRMPRPPKTSSGPTISSATVVRDSGAIVLPHHPRDGRIVPWCLRFLRGEPTPEVLQVVTEDLESQLEQVREYKTTLEETERKLAEAKRRWR
jgi:hypothetical protein